MFDPELCSSQMLLVDYYRSAPDLVQFSQYWCPDTTMLDKIKVKNNNNNNNIQISDQIWFLSVTLSVLLFFSPSSGLTELPRTQRSGLLPDPGARLQSAEQHAKLEGLQRSAHDHMADSPSGSVLFRTRSVQMKT